MNDKERAAVLGITVEALQALVGEDPMEVYEESLNANIDKGYPNGKNGKNGKKDKKDKDKKAKDGKPVPSFIKPKK